MKNHLRTLLVLALVGAPLLAAPPPHARGWDKTNADQTQFILRGPLTEVADIAARNGLTILHYLDNNDPAEGVLLVQGPTSLTPRQMGELVADDPAVIGFEPVDLPSLPIAGLEQSTAALLEQSTASLLEQSTASLLESTGTWTGAMQQYFEGPLWNGYADQPAMEMLGVHQAHAMFNGYGAGAVVAVIDNGVDPNHPLLRGALLPGYDFVDDVAGVASEWSNLDPATASELQQSTASLLEAATSQLLDGDGAVYDLEQSTAALLEQSTASLLEQHELPASFGHGTMVSGVVRLVAPGAMIMPLRAFDASGNAHLYDIVRAIHYAVDNGATIINMSFSTEVYSHELARAVNYAHRNGVICVAAAGNRSERVLTYPAALGFSLGVASTSYSDELSVFSNFGSDLVSLGAPGEALVTAFPGGSYAASSGTSFSTPLVAGTLALLQGATGANASSADFFKSAFALADGALYLPHLVSELAMGRLDTLATLGGK